MTNERMTDSTESPGNQIYLIRCEETGRFKIGVSLDPEKRLKRLQTGSPTPLELCASAPGGHELESIIHNKCKKYALRGEWFKPGVAEVFRDELTTENVFQSMARQFRDEQEALQREGIRKRRAFRVRRGRLLQAPGGNPWVLHSKLVCPSCGSAREKRRLHVTESGGVGECSAHCSRKWRAIKDVEYDNVLSKWSFDEQPDNDVRSLALDVHLWRNQGWGDPHNGIPSYETYNLLIAQDRCSNFCDRPTHVDNRGEFRGGGHAQCSGCAHLNRPPPSIITISHPENGDDVDFGINEGLRRRLNGLGLL